MLRIENIPGGVIYRFLVIAQVVEESIELQETRILGGSLGWVRSSSHKFQGKGEVQDAGAGTMES